MVSDSAVTKEEALAKSLNPCSNGIWSLTEVIPYTDDQTRVLILVLMEYGL